MFIWWLINDRHILIDLHMNWIFHLSSCSETIKWWVTDIDSSREVAVTHTHLGHFTGFLWLSLQNKKCHFCLLCGPSVTIKEETMWYLPFTCWGEYGSELESGGDSGSVLKSDGGRCYTHKNSNIWPLKDWNTSILKELPCLKWACPSWYILIFWTVIILKGETGIRVSALYTRLCASGCNLTLSLSLSVISLPPPLEELVLYLYKWSLIKYWLHEWPVVGCVSGFVACFKMTYSLICCKFCPRSS